MRVSGSPFVGLDFFVEDDTAFFFGRDAERQRIAGNLRTARLTLLYAESGVGKSSLLRAGVAARLREAKHGYVPVVFSQWGEKPVERLIAEIASAAGGNGDRPAIRDDSLEHALEDVADTTHATPLVILDQFEEHFLYSGADAERFDEALARCVNRRDLRANFLISIREDAYAGIGDRFKSRIPNVYGNYLHLDFLDLDAAREAIERPIAACNAGRPDGAPEIRLGPGLVDQVIAQVRRSEFRIDSDLAPDEAEEKQVETANLQLVMQRLWDEKPDGAGLTVETLESLGGAHAIVQDHLAVVMDGLKREQLPVAAKALRHLVTSSGRKIAMSPSELSDQSDVDVKELVPVLKRLGDDRILRSVEATRAGGERRYEIFHDQLAKAILEWRRQYVERRAREEASRAVWRKVAIAVAAAVVGGLIAIAAVLWSKQRDQTERAETSEASLSLASLADRQVEERPDLAMLFALEAYRASPRPEARSSLLSAYVAAWSAGTEVIIGGHSDFVSSVAFSPDGRTLATASNDKTIRLWDARTHRPYGRPLTGHAAAVDRIAFAPDGRMLASASSDGTIRFWSLATRREVRRVRPGTTPLSLAFAPDGRTLASGGPNVIQLFDTSTGRQRGRDLKGHSDWVRSVAFLSDEVLMSAGLDRKVFLWNLRTGRQLGQLVRKGAINAAAWAPKTRLIAVATATEGVWIYDVRRPADRGWRGPLPGDDRVVTVAFSRDGRRLAAAGYRTTRLYDARTRKQIGPVFNGHANWVNGLAFSPDGRTLASVSSDQTMRLWNLAAHTERSGVLSGHTAVVNAVSFSPDGGTLASAGGDSTVRLWDARTQRAIGQPLAGHTNTVLSVAFSPDGKRLVSAGIDETIRVWDVATRKPVGDPIGGHSRTVKAVAFHPSGKLFASGSDDSMVRFWDARTLRQLGASIRASADNFINAIAFSPDGALLATGSGDRSVRLWDVRTRRLVGKPLTGYDAPVTTVAFSPDGKLLAAGGTRRYTVFWDTATRRRVGAPLAARGGTLTALAFAADGRTLASASTDNTVRLWDVESRVQLGPTLSGHSQPVRAVAFSPDGGLIASGGDDSTVVLSPGAVWSDARALRRQICALATVRLGPQEWAQYAGGIRYRPSCR